MNGAEMDDNPQLDEWVVHDLNARPALPFADDKFDAAVCTVSVQYLTAPVEVFADVRRVLRPGGPFAVAFSNRCFPTKAVAIWRHGTDADHVDLVRSYFANADFSDVADRRLPSPDDPLFVVTGTA
jgi:SAM-dependent methyltransferase